MGYSSWGHKELDMTKQQQSNFPSILIQMPSPITCEHQPSSREGPCHPQPARGESRGQVTTESAVQVEGGRKRAQMVRGKVEVSE